MERGWKGLKSKAGDKSCPRPSALLSPAQTCQISPLRWQPDAVPSPALQHRQLSAREGFVVRRRACVHLLQSTKAQPYEGITHCRGGGGLCTLSRQVCSAADGALCLPRSVPRGCGQDQEGARAGLVLIYCSKWQGNSVPRTAPVMPDD